MFTRAAWVSAVVLGAAGCGGGQAGLGGDDQDGIVGGDVAFVVTVNDTAFSPAILTAQNLANVTLTLTNGGTSDHGLKIECNGAACFPGSAEIHPLAPGASSTAKFQTPRSEGIYVVTSNGSDQVQPGQFIVK
jgi:hypothetical protein